MNNSLFNSPLYWVVIGILIVIIIICYALYPKIIGWCGEHWTKKLLKTLPTDKYLVINDVLININNNYHQIDHIVVSQYGIFCIESKQYNGYIKGAKYDKYWIRYIGNKKVYYINPIKQNYGHVEALKKLLNLDNSKVINIVCIPSNAKLNIEDDGEVVRYNTLINKITGYKESIIHNYKELADKIMDNNIKDVKIRKEHIDSIRKKSEKNTNNCPKCGGKLVERTGAYGSFIGCSNYPKCKYTENK